MVGTDKAANRTGGLTAHIGKGSVAAWRFSTLITVSALALYCCKAHAKVNRKIENSTPCKVVTNGDFNLKLGTRDYGPDITHHACNFGVESVQWGLPPNRGNITLL